MLRQQKINRCIFFCNAATCIHDERIRAHFHSFQSHLVTFQVLNNKVAAIFYIAVEYAIFIGKVFIDIISTYTGYNRIKLLQVFKIDICFR